ncbi:MAG: hypothetical protein ACLGHL_02490, partial [Actinomycetota bacterium]
MKLSERLAQISRETERKAPDRKGGEREPDEIEQPLAEVDLPETSTEPEGTTAEGEDLSSKAASYSVRHGGLDYSRGTKKEGLEHLKAAIRNAVVKELGPKLASGAVPEDE